MRNLHDRKNSDITINFNIDDLDKAVDCYRFFYSHYYDRINFNDYILSD